MPEHTVQEGECITSIADQYGFFWETVWNDPGNVELQRLREDPNVLMAGDVVVIPELRERWESGDTEARHRFRKKGVPGVLRLRIMREPEPETSESQREETQYPPPASSSGEDPAPQTPPEDEARADVPVTVTIDGNITEIRTDANGVLEVSIPPGASSGRLVVEPGTPQESTIPLQLGHLNPVSLISGVKQRLANLGLNPGESGEEETPEFAAALREFQSRHDLEPTGELNDETRQRVQEVHGD